MSDWETVSVEYDGGITTITLDRPEKKNSMNPLLHEEMIEVMREVKEDAAHPDVGTKVLVLTGAGDSFCAGMSLDESFGAFEDDPWGAKAVSEKAMEWARDLREFKRPTIAKVNGWCFGAGVRVMCTCDMAIASDEAVFGLSEVNFGIFPAGASTKQPSIHLSPRDFLYLSLSGKDIDAEEADKIRLVNDVVPHAELDAEVADLAGTIADLNPVAVEFAKQVYQREFEENMTYETAVDYELAKLVQMRLLHQYEDMRAIDAFKEGKFKPGLETYDEDDLSG